MNADERRKTPLDYVPVATRRLRRAPLGGAGRLLFVINVVIFGSAIVLAVVQLLLGQ